MAAARVPLPTDGFEPAREQMMLAYDPIPWLMTQEGPAVDLLTHELSKVQLRDGSLEQSPMKTAGALNLLDDLRAAACEELIKGAASYLISALESQPGYERARKVGPASLQAPCDLCGFFGPYEDRNLPHVLAWGAQELNFYREYEPLLGPRSPVRAFRMSSLDRSGPGSCYSWGLIPLAYTIEALCRGGYAKDQRLQPAINALLGAQRESGGWCRNPGGHPSCTIHAIRTLGSHPELRRGENAEHALRFMRNSQVRRSDLFPVIQAAAAFDFPVARALICDGLAALAPRQRKNGTFGGPCAVERVTAVLVAEKAEEGGRNVCTE